MNTFSGINNKINIRVEDVKEKSNKKYDSVNDNTIVSNHTILSEQDKDTHVTDIFLDKNNDYSYNVNIGYNHKNKIIQKLKYARDKDSNYDASQPEFIIQTNGTIKVNSPRLQFKNKNIYFGQCEDNYSGDLILGAGAGLNLTLNKISSSTAKKPYQLFSMIDLANLNKLLLILSEFNNNNKIIVKDEFSSTWGSCGIIADNTTNNIYSNFIFTNCNFCNTAGRYCQDQAQFEDVKKPTVNLENLEVPEYLCGYEIYELGRLKFGENSNFTNLIIPSKIRYIGTQSLPVILDPLPNITNLIKNLENKKNCYFQENSFKNSNINKIYLNTDNLTTDSINSIISIFYRKQSFLNNYNLTSVTTISSSGPKVLFIVIDNDAFKNCFSLSDFPTNFITSLGDYSFANCGFKSLSLKNSSLLKNYTFYNNSKLENITFFRNEDYSNISNSIWCFARCEKLISVKGLANITTINSQSFFNGCTSFNPDLSTDFAQLTNLGDAIFYNTGLINAYSETLKTISKSTFAGCQELISVNFPNCSTLGIKSFSDNPKLKTVILGNTLSYPERTFENDENLESINKNSTQMVQDMGEYCFHNVSPTFINKENFPNLQTIGEYCFLDETKKDGKNITIELPGTVTDLPYGSIYNVNLEKFIGLGITKIYDRNSYEGNYLVPNIIKELNLPAFIGFEYPSTTTSNTYGTQYLYPWEIAEESYLEKAENISNYSGYLSISSAAETLRVFDAPNLNNYYGNYITTQSSTVIFPKLERLNVPKHFCGGFRALRLDAPKLKYLNIGGLLIDSRYGFYLKNTEELKEAYLGNIYSIYDGFDLDEEIPTNSFTFENNLSLENIYYENKNIIWNNDNTEALNRIGEEAILSLKFSNNPKLANVYVNNLNNNKIINFFSIIPILCNNDKIVAQDDTNFHQYTIYINNTQEIRGYIPKDTTVTINNKKLVYLNLEDKNTNNNTIVNIDNVNDECHIELSALNRNGTKYYINNGGKYLELNNLSPVNISTNLSSMRVVNSFVESSGHISRLEIGNSVYCAIQSVCDIILIDNRETSNVYNCHIKDWSLTKNIYCVLRKYSNTNRYEAYHLSIGPDEFQTLINTKSDNFDHLSIGISYSYDNEDEYNLMKSYFENITLTCNSTVYFYGPCNLRILDDYFNEEWLAKVNLYNAEYPSRYNPRDTYNDYITYTNHIYVSQILYDKLMTKYEQRYSTLYHYNSETGKWEDSNILSDPWIVVV